MIGAAIAVLSVYCGSALAQDSLGTAYFAAASNCHSDESATGDIEAGNVGWTNFHVSDHGNLVCPIPFSANRADVSATGSPSPIVQAVDSIDITVYVYDGHDVEDVDYMIYECAGYESSCVNAEDLSSGEDGITKTGGNSEQLLLTESVSALSGFMTLRCTIPDVDDARTSSVFAYLVEYFDDP